jgi:hypothetical protein
MQASMSRTDRAWMAMTVCVWALLILGLAVFSYLYPWSHTVYDIYARACRHWWNGRELYHARGTDYYRYSPLFAISLTPWAVLPDRWGAALWRIFNGLFYAAALWAWMRSALPAVCSRSQQAALFLLVLPLSAHSMQIGQANVMMVGALLLGVTAASTEKWNRAACWLALATLIKGYPLALALLVAALYPRRFFPRYAAALAVGLLLPFASQRPEFVLGQYHSWLVHLCGSTVLMRERLRTVEHLFCIYGYPLSPRTFLIVQLLAGLAILGFCLFLSNKGSGLPGEPWASAAKTEGVGVRVRVGEEISLSRLTLTPTPTLTRPNTEKAPDPFFELRQGIHIAFQLFTCWVVLFGPATETCTYIIIAPVTALALVEAFRRQIPWSGRILLIISFLMMGVFVTDLVVPTIRNFANEHGSQPIGALIFTCCLLVQMTTGQRVWYAKGRGQPAASRNVAA